MALIQASANKDKNVPTDIAESGHKPGQGLGRKDTAALSAVEHRLMGDKRTCQAQHLLVPCFLHDKSRAARAHVILRAEPDKWRFWEQCRRQCLLVELREASAKRQQSLSAAV